MTDPRSPRRRYAPRAGTAAEELDARRRRRRERFEALVARAIGGLPDRLRERIANVDIVIAERPTRAELRDAGVPPGETLFGLYHGTPQTKRDGAYGMVLPDKITLYQRPIEDACRDEAELVAEVRKTLLHELAHHFGIDDPRLTELGMD